MFQRASNQSSHNLSRLTGFEPLEPRRILDGHGVAGFGLCVPGDSDENGQFDQDDLIHVLQAGKYTSGEPADWREGDWDGDGLFTPSDVSAVLQSGMYLRGVIVDDLSSLLAKVPAHATPFGPPMVISNPQQLYSAVADREARDAIAEATDFASQRLLMFSWSGSGGDSLIAKPNFVAGRAGIEFQFRFGLTDDLRPHQVLLSLPADAEWHTRIEDAVVHDDTASYQFVTDTSRLLVSGGIAGVSDEYRIEGSIELTRSNDGTAALTRVNATLRGEGLSSLDGKPLDSVLHLSRLSGLQIGSSTVAMAGWDPSAPAVFKMQLFERNASLTLRGESIPPCCDFFVFEISASATALAE